MNYINCILLVMALGSGFAVVTIQNQSSQYHIELNKADKQREFLDKEYERMRLAQAQAAQLQRVKEVAEQQLLRAPHILDIKLMKR